MGRGRRTTCGRDSASQRGYFDLDQDVAPGRRGLSLVREPESNSFFKYQSGKPAPARGEAAPGRVATVRAQNKPALDIASWHEAPPRGGDVTVASEPGKGAVFTVRLPADT